MKTCKEYEQMISSYIDNELDSSLLMDFEEHIADCISCREELSETKSALELLENLEEEELTSDFEDKLHSRLVEEKSMQEKKKYIISLKSKYLRIAGSIAAILIFAFVIKGIYNVNNSKTSSSHESAKLDIAYMPEQTMADAKSQPNNSTQNNIALRKSINNDTIVSADKKTEDSSTEDIKTASATAASAADVTVSGNASPSLKMQFSEAVPAPADRVIKNTALTLKTENPEKEFDNIKAVLLQNGAKIIENTNIVVTAQLNAMRAADAPKVNNIHLEFMIQNSELSKVVDYLKATWGGDAFTSENLGTIKVTDRINQLNAELVALDKQSKSSDNSGQNKPGLAKIDAQKSIIQIEITDLKKAVDYTIVSMVVEKK